MMLMHEGDPVTLIRPGHQDNLHEVTKTISSSFIPVKAVTWKMIRTSDKKKQKLNKLRTHLTRRCNGMQSAVKTGSQCPTFCRTSRQALVCLIVGNCESEQNNIKHSNSDNYHHSTFTVTQLTICEGIKFIMIIL